MTNLVGLQVKLARLIDQQKPCCRNLAIIGEGKGPHAGALHCVDCGNHRGWLSKTTAAWIETVINKFGAPTTPIVVRPSSLDQEEAPDTDTNSH
jgi:hypothetical protein